MLRSECEVGDVYSVDREDCFEDVELYNDAGPSSALNRGEGQGGVGAGNYGLENLLLRTPMLADVVQY